MSVGTIPLLQRAYAELLEPTLEHGDTAIVFEGEADFMERVNEALAMTPEDVGAMKERVHSYYETHLTPQAVVAAVLSPDIRRIRLLAGEQSVALRRERDRIS